MSYGIRGCLLTRNINIFTIPKRFRYKKKWATHLKEKTDTERALEYFDVFYKPLYGKLWPSIRISLLSAQKYCALVNNFSADERTIKNLEKLGCRDIIQQAQETEPEYQKEVPANTEVLEEQGIDFSQDLEEDIDSTNLSAFLPVKKVYSSKQLLRKEEAEQSVYIPQEVGVKVIPCSTTRLPQHLKVFTYEPGNVGRFPSPKQSKTNLFDYYLLDAASILPVIALDVCPNDSVLDLCAAPGGKSLAILQTLLTEKLVCNDTSYSRLRRLENILRHYTGQGREGSSSTQIAKKDGRMYDSPIYDKVLVDVPCNTDRHVLQDDENNLFKPGRINERIDLTKLQKELLVSGIQSCKPGGSVVYSTCTLSFAQNDGVIESAFHTLMQETNIDAVVEDIRPLMNRFREVFSFFPNTRFGELVLPKLTSNFGPMYICKINRLT